jgi:hypothetical protein
VHVQPVPTHVNQLARHGIGPRVERLPHGLIAAAKSTAKRGGDGPHGRQEANSIGGSRTARVWCRDVVSTAVMGRSELPIRARPRASHRVAYGNELRQLDMGPGFPRTASASGLMPRINPARASRGVDCQLEVVPVDPDLT